MAKPDEKQLRIDYERVQKKNKELEKENGKLRSTSEELARARDSIKAEQQKTSNVQGQYNDLLKKTQGLEKAVENYSDPKELKDSLKESNQLVSEKESKIQELQRNVILLQKEKQDLLSKDDRSSEAMQQVQEKEKEIKHLENELTAAKKKLAKNEGVYPKLPIPNGVITKVTPLAEVIMEENKKLEASIIEYKNGVSLIMQVCTQDGKAVSVDFKKA